MTSLIAYCEPERELNLIEITIREIAAYLNDDEWRMTFCGKLADYLNSAENDVGWDMLCFDVSPEGAADALLRQRNKDNSAKLMIIANADTSPLLYIRPGIMATTLLLRPIDQATLTVRLRELYAASHTVSETDNASGEYYTFKSQDGMTRIRYSDILYFESRNKKLYLRTERTEYAFYDTLDSLSETLPDMFVRCHKSFIVNKRFIINISVSKGEINLSNDILLPLSRSYKQLVKDEML